MEPNTEGVNQALALPQHEHLTPAAHPLADILLEAPEEPHWSQGSLPVASRVLSLQMGMLRPRDSESSS